MNISPICFDFDVTEFPGEEGTCLLIHSLCPFMATGIEHILRFCVFI